jgi:hypothetical protein
MDRVAMAAKKRPGQQIAKRYPPYLLARQIAALKQITEGLGGDPRAAAKARVLLRQLFEGEIRLQPQPDGGLLARWNLQPAALLRGAGTCGSGGPIWTSRHH